MRMKNQITGILFSLALMLGMMPWLPLTAFADDPEPVPYRKWDEELQEIVDAEPCTVYTVVDSSTAEFTDGGWYVVESDVTAGSRINVNGTAHLILCDNTTLTAEHGIAVAAGSTLNIYGQSESTGGLSAAGDAYCAGIGGTNTSENTGEKDCGNVNIHGGDIDAEGGNDTSLMYQLYGGAGIGGGYDGAGGTVNIYGGKVTAAGGDGAAGIGSGFNGEKRSAGTVTVYGGTVAANGGDGSAGIGGGIFGDGGAVTVNGGTVTAVGGYSISIDAGAGIGGGGAGAGGTVTINGGTVTATGGGKEDANGAAGIGAGGWKYTEPAGDGGTVIINGGNVTAAGGYSSAGIGGGNKRSGGTVTVTGGEVKATGGKNGAGIGGGSYGTGGEIIIEDGTVTAVGGYAGAGIGGGNNMPGGTVTISGGTVDATGGVMGAGIGGGNYGDGGTVTIDGGTVTATGGGKDEGTVSIGGAAGIGGGSEGNGGTVAINGGKVTAAGSKGYYDLGMGIGAGEFQPDSQHSDGSLTLGAYVILEISKNGEDWTDSTDDPSKRTQYMRTSEAEVPEYTITYVLNGGSLNGRTGTVKEKHREGTVITLPAPVRDGYTFDYWEGSAYKAGDEYTVEEDHEFTAVWKSGGTDPSDDPSDDGGGGSDPSGRNTDGGSSSSGKKGVSTGDDSAAGAWITMFLIALAGTAGMVVLRKRDSL